MRVHTYGMLQKCHRIAALRKFVESFDWAKSVSFQLTNTHADFWEELFEKSSKKCKFVLAFLRFILMQHVSTE